MRLVQIVKVNYNVHFSYPKSWSYSLFIPIMNGTHNEFKDLPEVYCRAWAGRDPSSLLKLFAPDSVMTDHGAQIHVPRNFLERHHKHWNGAHDKFEVYLEYVGYFFVLPFIAVVLIFADVVCHTAQNTRYTGQI